MTDDKSLRRRWEMSDRDFINELGVLLHRHECDVLNILADFVASLCDVDIPDMFSSIDKTHVAQARWFFWHAYRYITKESFARIAERTKYEGHSFDGRSIAYGITAMSMMVEREAVWKKRWVITKRFIAIKNEADNAFCEEFGCKEPIKVTLTAPKGTKIELKET